MDQETRITLNTLLSLVGMLLQFALRVKPQRDRFAEVEERLTNLEARIDTLEQHQADYAPHRKKHHEAHHSGL
ncbi:MAG: hypothetical protein IT323_18600 [Anaerolineae bacterium]|nr:hypothetical protein [Anaerolineae bacterium]